MMLKLTNSRDPDFQVLINLLDKDLHDKYGSLQLTYNEFNIIPYIGTVAIAYHDSKPVGCGCFKEIDDSSIEIKRMFVKPDARGKGTATAILTELEVWAKSLGYLYAVLELGNKQPEAMGLYRKLGYTVITNYGPYIGKQTSICMRKVL